MSVISSHGLLPVLKATREYVDARHAAAIRMNPEDSSAEEQDDVVNQADFDSTESLHLIVQETIDEASGGILDNLRELAPMGVFVLALWDGIIAIRR